ncbi:hypothetical protein DIPPA_26289 [Diplonema papillatum]|nr:hypothetical protein DIPPA_26289 [Diplonema papillatum]
MKLRLAIVGAASIAAVLVFQLTLQTQEGAQNKRAASRQPSAFRRAQRIYSEQADSAPLDDNEAPVDDTSSDAPATIAPSTDSPPTIAPTIAPTVSPPTNAPTRIVVNASFVLDIEVDNATDAESKGNSLCSAIERETGITCDYQRTCSASECFERSILTRNMVALAVEEWDFRLELSTLMDEEELRAFLTDNGDRIVNEANVGGTFIRVDVNVTNSFDLTTAPATNAPPTIAPTIAPSTDSPPTIAPTIAPTVSPPTNAPTRIVVNASFVLDIEVDNATDAESKGNSLCSAIERDTGITCDYQRACSSSECFERSILTRNMVALAVEEWDFRLELSTLMEEEELRAFLTDNGDRIVNEANVGGTFIRVDVNVTNSFDLTTAPATNAPPTIAPTIAPSTDSPPTIAPTIAPTVSPPTNAPTRIVVNASFVLDIEVDNATDAESKGNSLCSAIERDTGITCDYQRACSSSECFERSILTRKMVALAVEEWDFKLELSTLMEEEELRAFLTDNGDRIVNEANVGGTFIRVDVNVTNSFDLTTAPATNAPPTIAPTIAPSTDSPPTIAPTIAPTVSPPTNAPTRIVVNASFVLDIEVDNATDAESKGNSLCSAIERETGITCDYQRTCSASECFERSILTRNMVALAVEEWDFRLELSTLMDEEELRAFLTDNGDRIVNEANVGGTFIRVDVNVTNSFDLTTAPATNAPPTIAPTIAPSTDSPPTIVPTNAPTRIVVDASFVLEIEVDNATDAESKGNSLCSAIERETEITCDYQRACSASECFERSILARNMVALAVEEWDFRLELSTLMDEEELRTFLTDNGDRIVNEANVGGTLIRVDVNVTNSFDLTTAPATNAPPTIAPPTIVPPTIAPTISPTNFPTRTLARASLVIETEVDNATDAESKGNSLCAAIEEEEEAIECDYLRACAPSGCFEKGALTRNMVALALEEWDFELDLSTLMSEEDLTKYVTEGGERIVSKSNVGGTFLRTNITVTKSFNLTSAPATGAPQTPAPLTGAPIVHRAMSLDFVMPDGLEPLRSESIVHAGRMIVILERAIDLTATYVSTCSQTGCVYPGDDEVEELQARSALAQQAGANVWTYLFDVDTDESDEDLREAVFVEGVRLARAISPDAVFSNVRLGEDPDDDDDDLSGGAIAGVVVACILFCGIIAAIVAFVVLGRKQQKENQRNGPTEPVA